MAGTELITLLQAEKEDLSEIHALCQEVAKKTPFSKWNSDYPNETILSQDIESRTLYKAVFENRIISVIQIRSWEDFMKNEENKDLSDWDETIHRPCGLGRFCVSPALQGCGLGRKILTAALKKAYDFGYDGAFFHVVEGNIPALHLYDSMGFHCAGDIEEYGLHFLCYEIKFDTFLHGFPESGKI